MSYKLSVSMMSYKLSVSMMSYRMVVFGTQLWFSRLVTGKIARAIRACLWSETISNSLDVSLSPAVLCWWPECGTTCLDVIAWPLQRICNMCCSSRSLHTAALHTRPVVAVGESDEEQLPPLHCDIIFSNAGWILQGYRSSAAQQWSLTKYGTAASDNMDAS